jgi:DNA-binding response OmpR family regulator
MRILLIEDDGKVASAVTKNLKSDGFAVDRAGDGLRGEELAKTNDYDVILLDIMLPVQDGWTTCRNIRKAAVTIPILMLTALGNVDERIRGLDGGADDYLTKPFHHGELVARIRSLARRHTDVRSSVIERCGVRLDTARHKAYRRGKEISLSTKEFALLELLMMHSEKIVTREMIIEHVWDMNFSPRSNVIESFVRYLRRKLEGNSGMKLIHTVRGSGYVMSKRKA